MLTDQLLEEILTRAYRAKAAKTPPVPPDDLIMIALELKRQRWDLERLRRVWLGEREPNQAVYQEHHDWVLHNWPGLAEAIEQLISEVPPQSR